MKGTAERVSNGREAASFPRAVPCRGHAFGDALMCRCGASWWAHQRTPEKCRLNARGRNQGLVPAEGKAGAARED